MKQRKMLEYSRIGLPFPEMAGDLLMEGIVHSVFEHSVNLKIPELNGKLLTIFTASGNTFPGSIYVDDLQTEDFHVGDPVLIRENCLIAGDHILIPSPDLKKIDLQLDSSLLGSEIPKSMGEKMKSKAVIAREEKLSGNETESLVYDLLKERIVNLIEAVKNQEISVENWETKVLLAARSLIGLGFGLTPSGDDMLLGIMAVLKAANHPAFDLIAGKMEDMTKGTTDVSRSYLLYASEGSFSDMVLRTLEEMGKGEETAIKRLLSFGHLSGSDTLYGMASFIL